VYSLKLGKDLPALKAISQNLMHLNISITDGVYGILSDNDVRGQIAGLEKQIFSSDNHDIEELKILIKQLCEKLGIAGF
jgi:hypothetical protein